MTAGRPSANIRTGAFLGIIISLLLLGSCAPKVQPEAPWEKDARTLLNQAEKLLSKRQYSQSEKLVSTFRTRYPQSRQMDRALYLMGENRLSQRDYSGALSYYKEIIERFPSSSFIIDAKYRLGWCYFELQEYDLAIANLKDKSKINDPAKLRRASEMLAASYMVKHEYHAALSEYLALIQLAQYAKQQKGYQDRVKEIINTYLSRDELEKLSEGTSYPADVALLRLAGLLIEQRKYGASLEISTRFLDRYPSHPERMRAEMLKAEAKVKLTEPRYLIGALVPQSGRLAFFGDKVLNGIQLAIHSYNLRNPDDRVELVVKDTRGSPKKSREYIAELLQKGVVAVIGPLLTREAEAIAPTLERIQIPVITPAASGPRVGELSPWLFRNALTNANQAAAAARHALEKRHRKFVILYPDDAYGKGLSLLFNKELVRRAEILAEISYPPDTKDFGPFIRKIIEIDLRSQKIPLPEEEEEKQALIREYAPSFDAIYIPGYADRVGLLIPQLAFYNVTEIAMIGSNNWHAMELIERAGRHVEGAVFVDGFFPESEDRAVEAFIETYRSAYQENPDILAAQAYDATMMILSLLQEGNSTPEAVRDGLIAMEDFPGISGYTTFKENGEAQKELFLITIEDGRFVQFKN